jgi:hypothetical protein
LPAAVEVEEGEKERREVVVVFEEGVITGSRCKRAAQSAAGEEDQT